MEEERLDLTPKGQLLGGLLAQAGIEQEAAAFRAFVAQITDEQAAQLLDLDGFTENYQIPIWDNETGGPPRDPNRQHETPPDRYMEGTTTPRRIIDDLAAILPGTESLEEVQGRVEALPRLNTINPQYWERVSAILGKPEAKLPSVTGKRVQKFDFPVDKVNSEIWKILEYTPEGQIGIADGTGIVHIATEKKGSKWQVSVLYSINFDALGDNVSITRKLTPFDKRVYLAVSALYNAGNRIISFSQIYRTMGNTHSPNAHDIEKIADSIAKMAAARIYIDNKEEVRAKYRYDKFTYEASLLPMERLEGVINGKAVEAAIHLFREPPLVSFARGRKQITTIERQLLETPVNKTDQNLLLEDYLIERIAHAKTGRQPAKILYDTLYAEARITTKKQRQRAGDKLGAILGHYVKCGFIKGYTDEGDGIRIDL